MAPAVAMSAVGVAMSAVAMAAAAWAAVWAAAAWSWTVLPAAWEWAAAAAAAAAWEWAAAPVFGVNKDRNRLSPFVFFFPPFVLLLLLPLVPVLMPPLWHHLQRVRDNIKIQVEAERLLDPKQSAAEMWVSPLWSVSLAVFWLLDVLSCRQDDTCSVMTENS